MSIEIILTNDEVAQAERIGRARQGVHEEFGNDWNAENRFYDDSAKTNVIGMYGEVGFGRLFNLPVDEELRPEGDNGIDFVLHMAFDGVVEPFSIDVKTAVYPKYLLIREHEIDYPTDLYILCKYAKFDRRLEYLGWEWRVAMRHQPVKDYGGYGIISYGKDAGQLRSMDEFSSKVEQARRMFGENLSTVFAKRQNFRF